MSFEGIAKFVSILLCVGMVGLIGTIGLGIYVIYENTGTQTYESKVKIKPDYRLEANGKKVDTVYIYKFK
jgi:hypothetical protein